MITSTLLTQIGIPAAIVVIILREVFNFLKSRKPDNKTQCALGKERVDQMTQEIKEVQNSAKETNEIVQKIFDMHNIKDNDGVYSWYVPRSWSDIQKDIVVILQHISNSQESIASTLERIERKSEKE